LLFLKPHFLTIWRTLVYTNPHLKMKHNHLLMKKIKMDNNYYFSGFLAERRRERERKRKRVCREGEGGRTIFALCLCMYVCVCVCVCYCPSLSLNCCQVKWVVGLLLGQFQSPLFDVIKRTLVTNNETGGKKFTTFCLFTFIYISSGNLMMLPMMQEGN